MTKMFFLLFFLFFLFTSISMFHNSYFLMDLSYFSSLDLYSMPFSFLSCLDSTSLLYISMVFLVTCLVSMYSEIYMSHYNNKKFFALMVSFLLSMLILSLSNSTMPMMMGWDGLGVTSICLIMFYPNKITLYNSVMTMFFNRLGDVFMISSFAFLYAMSNSSNVVFSDFCYYVIFIIFLCSFTKSAQFPFSSWLPAAMSAPTPISAMVHSSTLVTAGIFLVLKFNVLFEISGLLEFLFFVSFLTFLLGGFLGVLESDFKKVVAFSTMSQISMIMVFLSLALSYLALAHLFFHALFKTLLFCCAGVYFLYFYGEQYFPKMKSALGSDSLTALLFFSIFSMTGYIFSASFFSKDMFLELVFKSHPFMLFFIFLLGSFMTLLYCSKILSSSLSFYSSSSTMEFKSYYNLFFFLFLLFLMVCGKILGSVLIFSEFPMINSSDVMLMVLLLLIPIFIGGLFFNKLYVYNFVASISYMKLFSYSFFNFIFMNKFISEVKYSDHLFFKSYYLNISPKLKGMNIFNGYIALILILLSFIL